MNRIAPLVLMLLAFSTGFGQSTAQQKVLPKQFSIWSGGIYGSRSVEWNGKALVYREVGSGGGVTNRTIQPSNKQWQEFWASAEKLQLSKWIHLYEDPALMDGQVWNIEIVRGKEKIQVTGRNAYPADDDP